MKKIKQLLALSLLAATGLAWAHGDEDHGNKGAAQEGHASALGQPGDPKKVSRTVEITMSDAMRFNPSSVSVKRNETVRFMLRNDGKLKHEMVLGTIQELKEHAALMLKFPEMEHSDPNQLSVAPGKTGALVWQFTKAGTFDFACLQPGHYEAGMKGQVVVAGPAATKADNNDRSADVILAQANTNDDMSEGEIRKVDKDAKKITIKHGEIKNLDMPGMTMVFQVTDSAALDRLKVGDKVRFRASNEGGKLMANDITPAK